MPLLQWKEFFLKRRQAEASSRFGSDEKTAEKENAQNHDYRDYDDLD